MTEPGRRNRWSWRIGKILGIDVFVHATFLVLLAWVAIASYRADGSLEKALAALALMLVVFGSVVLHELGHALTARRFGIRTRDIILLPIGGVARLERMPERPGQELLVAIAGPAVSLSLAAMLELIGRTTGSPPVIQVAQINLMLGLFNLLPAFPMDGGRILRAGLAWRGDRRRATTIAAKVGQAVALGLATLGLFGNPVLVLIAAFVWFGAAAEANATNAQVLMSNATATAAMMTEFRTLSTGDTLDRAAQLLLQGSQSDFPVVETDGRVVGMLTRDRLVAALSKGAPDRGVGSAMQAPIVSVSADAALGEVARQMQESGLSAIPVVENGLIRGLVTLENLGEWLVLRGTMPGSPDR